MINDAGIFMAVMISCRHPHLTLPTAHPPARDSQMTIKEKWKYLNLNLENTRRYQFYKHKLKCIDSELGNSNLSWVA